jgi:hypothetical protein
MVVRHALVRKQVSFDTFNLLETIKFNFFSQSSPFISLSPNLQYTAQKVQLENIYLVKAFVASKMKSTTSFGLLSIGE